MQAIIRAWRTGTPSGKQTRPNSRPVLFYFIIPQNTGFWQTSVLSIKIPFIHQFGCVIIAAGAARHRCQFAIEAGTPLSLCLFVSYASRRKHSVSVEWQCLRSSEMFVNPGNVCEANSRLLRSEAKKQHERLEAGEPAFAIFISQFCVAAQPHSFRRMETDCVLRCGSEVTNDFVN